MPKIYMASLGCAKNMVDAETMLGETLGGEFDLELAPEAADVIIVNTCGFIQEARDEAREVIGELIQVKKAADHDIKVVATGCWAERSPNDLLQEFPDLDAVWGLATPSAMGERILALSSQGGVSGLGKPKAPREGARLITTLPSFAYLRLSDGCDNRCHYCAIPLIRGGLRSRRPGAIVDEAKALEEQGVKELILIAQDTTAYGSDFPVPGGGLASLLEELLTTVSLPRLRLLYAHPAHLDDAVCDILVNEPRLCGYLDLPLQHASDRVLAAMGRGYGRDRITALLERFAGRDFTLRTTLLLGFPGEREEDFLQALDLVRAGHFRHLGAFAYSPEPDTPAYSMPEQVPAAEAARRRDAVLEAQGEVAFAWLDSRVGGTESVLLDAHSRDGWLVGRSRNEAPDADGAVFVRSPGSAPGDIIDACIKRREGYDLLAESNAPGRNRRNRRGSRK